MFQSILVSNKTEFINYTFHQSSGIENVLLKQHPLPKKDQPLDKVHIRLLHSIRSHFAKSEIHTIIYVLLLILLSIIVIWILFHKVKEIFLKEC